MIEEGQEEQGGQKRKMLLVSGVIWLEESESMTQSVMAGGLRAMVLKELANNRGSQEPVLGDC